MNSTWNRIIYKLWPPIYDQLFDRGPFLKARKKIFSSIPFQKGQSVLLVGVGTGADFKHIPFHHLEVTAIDYSVDMLAKAKVKVKANSIIFSEMDAQNLFFPDKTFDWVIASLILSVVPDGEKALAEMARVTRKKGHIVVFDKFTPKGTGLSYFKRLVRPLILLLGTDIGVSSETLLAGSETEIIVQEDQGVLFNGMYRKIVLEKV